jgi:hypothetical protein
LVIYFSLPFQEKNPQYLVLRASLDIAQYKIYLASDRNQTMALVRTDVSEKRIASIIRVERISELGTT